MHKPGFPPGVHLIGGRNGARAHAENADEFYAPIIPIVAELRRQGMSLRAIARELDRRGIRTRFDSWYESEGSGPPKPRIIRWNAAQVRRILIRAASRRMTPPDPT